MNSIIVIILIIAIIWFFNSSSTNVEKMGNITGVDTICNIDNVNGVVPYDPYRDNHQIPYDTKACYTSTMLKPVYSLPAHFAYERIYPTQFYDRKYNPWPRFDDLRY